MISTPQLQLASGRCHGCSTCSPLAALACECLFRFANSITFQVHLACAVSFIVFTSALDIHSFACGCLETIRVSLAVHVATSASCAFTSASCAFQESSSRCWMLVYFVGFCEVVMAGLEFFVARHLDESYQVWGARSYLHLQYAKACRHSMNSILRYPSTCQLKLDRVCSAQAIHFH